VQKIKTDPIKGGKRTKVTRDWKRWRRRWTEGDGFQIQLGINNSSVPQHSAVTNLYNNMLCTSK
jgi:hypothetical protein